MIDVSGGFVNKGRMIFMFGNKLEKIEKLAAKGDAAKIAEYVNDKHDDVRMAAIDALGKCQGDDAFNALVPLVHGGDVEQRKHAALALGSMNVPRARAFLEHQSTLESDADVKKAIETALSEIKDVE